MKRFIALLTTVLIAACGGAPAGTNDTTLANSATPGAANGNNGIAGQDDFGLQEGDASATGTNKSNLKPSDTHALLRFVVRNDDGSPIPKVVVKGEAADGTKFYTTEADETGYTEVLAPIGKQYTLSYLSLFKDKIEKKTVVPNEVNVTIKLTLNYIAPMPKPIVDEGVPVEIPQEVKDKGPALILDGVVFDTAKAKLKEESFEHLEAVIEYMTYKPSSIIEISGHTDNKGNYDKNMKLSQDRAMSVRDYLVSKGVEGDRIMAVGYGPDVPISSNDTEEGRQKNRRVEARDIAEI